MESGLVSCILDADAYLLLSRCPTAGTEGHILPIIFSFHLEIQINKFAGRPKVTLA
jgi:hypothetical protein